MPSEFDYEPFSTFDHFFETKVELSVNDTDTSSLQPSGILEQTWEPDIYEMEDRENKTASVAVQLPGFEKEEVRFECYNNCLTVSVEYRNATGREDPLTIVSRSLDIPFVVKESDITTEIIDGFWIATFPTNSPEQEP